MHESYKILLSLTHEGILLITQRNMDKTLLLILLMYQTNIAVT